MAFHSFTCVHTWPRLSQNTSYILNLISMCLLLQHYNLIQIMGKIDIIFIELGMNGDILHAFKGNNSWYIKFYMIDWLIDWLIDCYTYNFRIKLGNVQMVYFYFSIKVWCVFFYLELIAPIASAGPALNQMDQLLPIGPPHLRCQSPGVIYSWLFKYTQHTAGFTDNNTASCTS